MLFIHLFSFLGAVLLGICFWGVYTQKGALTKRRFAALLVAALAIRLTAAALSHGFGTDTACFAAWADRIFQVGPSGFYSADVFTDYPPGYMYILWIVGALRSLFSIPYYSVPHLILLKLPSIACDMACGMLLYRESAKKLTEKQAWWICGAYLLNPAIILNSSVWGQVDSILALAAACMCLYLIRGKMYPAYIAFGIGVLMKPQMLLFFPVLFLGGLEDSLQTSRQTNAHSWTAAQPFSVRNTGIPAVHEGGSLPQIRTFLLRLLHNLFQGLSAAAGVVILCLPFGLENVWKQYLSTLGSYAYAAVNACNFWGLLGLNWVSQDNLLLGVPYRIFGSAAIAAAVILVLFLGLKYRRHGGKYPFLAAFLVLTIFLFSVRMHERYMYPGLLLLLLTYVYQPSPLIWLCYGGFSVMHFYNTAAVLFLYDPSNYNRKSPFIIVVSIGMLVCGGLLYYMTYRFFSSTPLKSQTHGFYSSSHNAGSHNANSHNGLAFPPIHFSPRPSRKAAPLKTADYLCMLTLTVVYSCFALYDLGDRQAPVTSFDMGRAESVTLDFGTEIPAALSYYIAPWHGRNFSLEWREKDSDTWTSLADITFKNVFTWQTLSFGTDIPLTADMHQLRLTLKDNQASLLELVFVNGEGNVIRPSNAEEYASLFDEANLYPEAPSFRNGMYFDEIYHARTAYEFLHGLTSYENTHPPLGKVWIALGVAIFGMNPFGWRIIGTLFGIAMVPLVYLFARRIASNTGLAALACVLFTFDFMHFTQTRIATIDVYITFFVILMYYFMYQYSCLSFYDTPLKKTWLPLGACGVCMGLGVACKWTGVYAGCGLALIFFSVLFRRYLEYRSAMKDPLGETNGIFHTHIKETFFPYAKRTIGFCLIFFVLIPAGIYLLSYLPFRDYSDRGLIAGMLHNQETMFNYHSTLNSTHAYSSLWYEWPTLKRPIWYYSRIITRTETGGLREGISAFGNPAVWWLGIPASLYTLYLWIRKKDRTAAFLLVGYLAQYLPWFFVTRVTFIYHYFPSVVFVVLMILYSMMQWRKKLPKPVFCGMAVLYGAAVIGLFLLFYPVLSGQPVEAEFVAKYLRWFSGWVLTAR